MTKFDHGQSISWNAQNQPYSDTFEDHFFSAADGRAETQHVFLNGNSLPHRWTKSESFTIAELGFGTGLNFLETWRSWQATQRAGQHLYFTSFEAFPLTCAEISKAILSWPDLAPLAAALPVHWSNLTETPTDWMMDDQTSLRIVVANALDGVRAWNGKADAWYLDGFSPSNNPDMWSADLMKAVFDHTMPDGTLATYTAAGWVRRNLAKAGFKVSRIQGYGHKRHMTIGVRTT